MPGFDFDVMREKKRNNFDRSKAFRLIILFCVIAAITALVIYAIIPGSDDSDDVSADTPAAESAADPADSAETPATADPASTPDTPAAPATGDTSGGSTAADPSAASGGSTAAGSSGQSSAAPAGQSRGESSAKYNPSNDELADHTRRLRRQLADGSWKNASHAVRHTVINGDRVALLARQYRTTPQFIRKYNSLNDNDFIVTGQELFFINAPGGWQVTVSKKQQTLQIDRMIDGQPVPFAIFRCQTSTRLPLRSDLVICQRRVKSDYRDNQGRVFTHGNAGNPYGDYRLILAAANAPQSPILHLSIHDAGDKDALAAVLRDGSMILSADDIELLYLLIPKGTPVKIIE